MRYLVDTNVLLRWAHADSPDHSVCTETVDGLLKAGHEPCICAQVLIEFRAVATRPADVNGLGLTSSEVRDALAEPVATVVDAVRMTLEKTPPELAADIMDRGIVMAGGGSLLRGLDKYIAQETDMSVYVVDDPISCVAYGTGKILEEIDTLKKVLIMPKSNL